MLREFYKHIFIHHRIHEIIAEPSVLPGQHRDIIVPRNVACCFSCCLIMDRDPWSLEHPHHHYIYFQTFILCFKESVCRNSVFLQEREECKMLLSNIFLEYLKVAAWSVHGRGDDEPVPDYYLLVLLAFVLLKQIRRMTAWQQSQQTFFLFLV